jgi:predicted HicB family RNase H-like nuclease
MGQTSAQITATITHTSETVSESDARAPGGRDRTGMGSNVLSLRIDGELLDRIRQHAAKRGMSVQDYVVRTLMRDDFDERFNAAVDETEKFYGVT